MVSLQRIITGTASTFNDSERYALLKMLYDLACVDSRYDVIEKIGIESIAAVLFPEPDAETVALERLEQGEPGISFSDPEKRALCLEVLCSIALMDDEVHPAEVQFIAGIAESWGIGLAALRRMSCFDPIRLLELGLAGSGETLLEELGKSGL